MAALNNQDWKPWNEERKRFLERETQGYQEDIYALEQHIFKLLEVCPKDKTNFPHLSALDVINKLKVTLHQARAFFGEMPEEM